MSWRDHHGVNATVIGLVADARSIRFAATMLVMLRDRANSIPVVLFVGGEQQTLPDTQVTMLRTAGVSRVVPLHRMPVPAGEFATVLARGRGGRKIMFERLGLWSHVEYSKIISLDLDLFVAANIDEMASFPRNTWSPNICQYGCDHRVAGHNSGVMVVGPSTKLFLRMSAFAQHRAAGGAVGRAERLGIRRGRQNAAHRAPLEELLVDQEQSFLSEFFADEYGVNIEADAPERAGHDWTWREFADASLCDKGVAAATAQRTCGGRVRVMSRRYNARPGDCDRCPSDYQPKLIHFACAAKPLHRHGVDASQRYWESVRANASRVCGRGNTVCSSCTAESQLGYLAALQRAEDLMRSTEAISYGPYVDPRMRLD
jgi:hypothetical protein